MTDKPGEATVMSIEPFHGECVKFNTDDATYIRYSADNWRIRQGGLYEPVLTGVDKLEAAYQAYIARLSAKPL